MTLDAIIQAVLIAQLVGTGIFGLALLAIWRKVK